METMLFANKVVCDNPLKLIQTVRRGIYWGYKLKEGQEIQIMSTSEAQEYPEGADLPITAKSQKAVITQVVVKRYKDLKDSDLDFNFEPSCRNTTNLFIRMKEIYPAFEADEIITSVTMRLK